jgi:hypothetical protein
MRIFILLLFIFSSTTSQGEDLFGHHCVVLLSHEQTEIQHVNSTQVPGATNIIQRMTRSFGTGFFVVSAENGLEIYLITAKHVAEPMKLGPGDKVYGSKPTNQLVVAQLSAIASTTNWIHHPTCDVSILPIDPMRIVLEMFGFETNGPKRLFSLVSVKLGSQAPPRNELLLIAGFPFGLGVDFDNSTFSALTRETKAASGLIGKGDFFLLQDPAVQGFSGAPVFSEGPPNAANRIYGVVSSTFADSSGGKMGQVISSRKIMELIETYRAGQKR